MLGFGFSDKPAERGWNAARIAKAWAELMRRLGYSCYVAQGGDWGAIVTTALAQQQPYGLAGIHLNMPIVFPDPIPTTGLSAAEQRAVEKFKRFDGVANWLGRLDLREFHDCTDNTPIPNWRSRATRC